MPNLTSYKYITLPKKTKPCIKKQNGSSRFKCLKLLLPVSKVTIDILFLTKNCSVDVIVCYSRCHFIVCIL